MRTPDAHEQPAPDADALGVYAAREIKSQSGEGRGEGVRTMLVARRGFVSVVHINQCKRSMQSCIVAAERAIHPASQLAVISRQVVVGRNPRHSRGHELLEGFRLSTKAKVLRPRRTWMWKGSKVQRRHRRVSGPVRRGQAGEE